MERALYPMLQALPPGVVIDVGAKSAPYRSLIRATEYLTLDIRPESGADIIGDIHSIPRASESVDAVICTEVLEHCRDPRVAVGELHRLLRPGGVCLLTTRFIHLYHPDPEDYFRFTSAGLGELFKAFSTVEVVPLGDRFASIWMLLPRRFHPLEWLMALANPAIASRRTSLETRAPCGYLVRAVA
jgi:SAM-dependent methyltransferase